MRFSPRVETLELSLRAAMTQQELFFRVLLPPPFADHIRRWREKRYTSFHRMVPEEWTKIWRNRRSTDAGDYTLDCRLGTFTAAARSTFLEAVKIHGDPDRFPEDVRVRASELAGVCAFGTPEAAAAWARDCVDPRGARLVDFVGRYVCDAPEDNGVVAEVIEVRASGTLEAFGRRHGLQQT